jgi:hypothetical protein
MTIITALWPRAAGRSERGQTTAEYALVLLGVAAVALALTTWAGGGRIGAFLDAVFDRLLSTAS